MRPTQCVGGLNLTVVDSLATLPIDNNNKLVVQIANSKVWNGFQKNYFKSHSSALDIILFNVRSLPEIKKNIEELLLNLTKKPEIIAITETKLNDNNIARTQLKDFNLMNCSSSLKQEEWHYTF